MAILRQRTTSPTTNHEALFIERYQRLLGMALQLTDGDRERAEDIVHDAFIQFSFSRPEINSTENLEGYLYGMLRKLHLSQMRRDSRSRIQPHFLVEYDSAEWCGARSGKGIGGAVFEGAGSDAPQHARALHATAEGGHRAGSWIRTVARRSICGRSRKINEFQENGPITDLLRCDSAFLETLRKTWWPILGQPISGLTTTF
jgi:hypothetical protein